eukprot:NODE_7900_length_1540_cov_8.913659.p3 GENE.NODE_7900_length_1540_cov_8.913659~~NODE_7900_length_1540_cov_8.913659.p3  ORF type:complete len:137 (+),score=20.69 NODE_7900_length_1540_cov_8.913659:502-912(+)
MALPSCGSSDCVNPGVGAPIAGGSEGHLSHVGAAVPQDTDGVRSGIWCRSTGHDLTRVATLNDRPLSTVPELLPSADAPASDTRSVFGVGKPHTKDSGDVANAADLYVRALVAGGASVRQTSDANMQLPHGAGAPS